MKTRIWVWLIVAGLCVARVTPAADINVEIPGGSSSKFNTRVYFNYDQLDVGGKKTLRVYPAQCYRFSATPTTRGDANVSILLLPGHDGCQAEFDVYLISGKEGWAYIDGNIEPDNNACGCSASGGGGAGPPPTGREFEIEILNRLAWAHYTTPANGTNLTVCACSTNDIAVKVVLGDLSLPNSGTVTWTPALSNLGSVTPASIALSGGNAASKFYAGTDGATGTLTANATSLTFAQGNPVTSVSTNLALHVVKVEIGMDGNRDGNIDFNTPDDQKYLFWVNNDIDVISGGEEDDAQSGTKNCEDNVITCKRDLEDFTRLHIRVDDVTASSAGFTYFLRFDSVTGSPEANIFEAVNESLAYLQSDTVAVQQITKTKLLTVSSTEQALPTTYIKTGNQKSFFLLEGKRAGKGTLSFIVKKHGVEICNKSVSLDLKEPSEFVQKYVVTTSTDDGVNPFSTQVGTYTYTPAENKYLLYVHGWNMEDWEKDRWTETAFKRLWWQGYKGHVGSFQWPTLGMLYYDRSEFRAWNSAQALKNRISSLNTTYPGQIRVIAHSMGNVVMGETLRLFTSSVVHTYIAAQAAIPVHCYDNTIANYWAGFTTPNVYGYYSTGTAPSDPYLKENHIRAGQLVQYHNAVDYALSFWWETNNETKPDLNYHYTEGDADVNTYDPGAGDRFYYDSISPFDERTLVVPGDRFEIFARCAESRARALGKVASVAGFGITRNLQDWGYDSAHYSHSREFRSNIVAEWPFWQAVKTDGGL